MLLCINVKRSFCFLEVQIVDIFHGHMLHSSKFYLTICRLVTDQFV
jgi:hypothetical protein